MDAHGEEVACVQRRAWMELPQNRFLRGIYLLVQRYLRHNVGMQGAALAFYLLFMIFPLLIFVSSLLGLLQLDVDAILAAVQEFLPREIVSFIGVYLTYVGRNPSVKLLLFGLFFSLYFPMRATNTLMRSVRIAYHLGPPRGALPQLVKTLLYTAVLIATIDADVCGRPAATLRRGQLRPAPVLGGAVGEAAVPGGGGGRVFRPVLPVRPVSGRPPALAEHLARHYGGPGGLAGAELAVLHIRGELCRLLPAVRLHRHGHRPFDLAVYDRRDPYHGGGAERHADLPAKGPGGGIVNDF